MEITKFVRYTAQADTKAQAWAFIMAAQDILGEESDVEINSITSVSADTEVKYLEVTVYGEASLSEDELKTLGGAASD